MMLTNKRLSIAHTIQSFLLFPRHSALIIPLDWQYFMVFTLIQRYTATYGCFSFLWKCLFFLVFQITKNQHYARTISYSSPTLHLPFAYSSIIQVGDEWFLAGRLAAFDTGFPSAICGK